jgi:hypothetical protein
MHWTEIARYVYHVGIVLLGVISLHKWIGLRNKQAGLLGIASICYVLVEWSAEAFRMMGHHNNVWYNWSYPLIYGGVALTFTGFPYASKTFKTFVYVSILAFAIGCSFMAWKTPAGSFNSLSFQLSYLLWLLLSVVSLASILRNQKAGLFATPHLWIALGTLTSCLAILPIYVTLNYYSFLKHDYESGRGSLAYMNILNATFFVFLLFASIKIEAPMQNKKLKAVMITSSMWSILLLTLFFFRLELGIPKANKVRIALEVMRDTATAKVVLDSLEGFNLEGFNSIESTNPTPQLSFPVIGEKISLDSAIDQIKMYQGSIFSLHPPIYNEFKLTETRKYLDDALGLYNRSLAEMAANEPTLDTASVRREHPPIVRAYFSIKINPTNRLKYRSIIFVPTQLEKIGNAFLYTDWPVEDEQGREYVYNVGSACPPDCINGRVNWAIYQNKGARLATEAYGKPPHPCLGQDHENAPHCND